MPSVRSTVRLYWEIARRGYRRAGAYRGAVWAGVFTNTVFGFIRAYAFVALLRAVPRVGGFDLTDALTYTFVTQGLLMTIAVWGWQEVALQIRTGSIVTDLFRPFDYQVYWMSQDLGRALYHAVFRGFPPFAVGALAFDLRLPHNPLTWLAFAASVTLAVSVSFGLRFGVNLSAFWLLDHAGVYTLAQSVWTGLSGVVIPIAFFPGALRTVTRLLPFAALVEAPVEVFLEKPGSLAGVLGVLAGQAAWAVVLFVAGRAALSSAARRVVVQGG